MRSLRESGVVSPEEFAQQEAQAESTRADVEARRLATQRLEEESAVLQIDRRARKAARLVALVSTLVVGLYVFIRVPADDRARLVGAAAVLIWFGYPSDPPSSE